MSPSDPVHTGEVVEVVPCTVEKDALDSHFDTLDLGTNHMPFHLEPNSKPIRSPFRSP